MYSDEYRCTNVDTLVTTTSITTVKLSYLNPHGTLLLSDSIHGNLLLCTTFPCLPTSEKALKDLLLVNAVQLVVITTAPRCPLLNPPLEADLDPNRGLNLLVLYIVVVRLTLESTISRRTTSVADYVEQEGTGFEPAGLVDLQFSRLAHSTTLASLHRRHSLFPGS